MRASRLAVASVAAVIAVGAWVAVARAQLPQPQLPNVAAPLPLGARGEPIYPAFEGWGPLQDGQNAFLIGYKNDNTDQTLDIPIGPNNHMDPGGPDMLQPTHFEAGRAWGVFAVPVAKDFGAKNITWTLVANGRTTVVQFALKTPYWVDFYTNAAKGNTPPVIKFAANGPEMTGPPRGVAMTLNATVGQPLTLKLWAHDRANTYDPEDSLPPELRSRGRGAAAATPTAAARGAAPDATGARGRGADAQNFDFSAAVGRGATGGRAAGGGRGGGPQPDVTVTWKIHRGSSPVKFADDVIRLFNKGDADAVMEATTTATFSAPGDYMLRAQVNDNSGDGGGGEQCCWTNALVRVNVK
jgi:hypothetical protein